MLYRKFGKLDWKGSALGFGAMRLPVIDRNEAKIDEPEAIRMIRYAIDCGVNYLDTGYMYHSGNSEIVVGKALKDGYRDKIKLATKLPARNIKTSQEFDRIFNMQLERLQTMKIDFYLLHGLNAKSWAEVRDLGVMHWAESMIAKGHIDYLGFSFHDDYKVFQEIIDAYDNWTVCQIQYNFIDENYQAGRRGVEYAAGKKLAVIAMEPLRGGKLATKPPEQVIKVWERASQNISPVERALQWVWNQQEVSLALSGMSTMEQVVENVAIASRSGAGMPTTDDPGLFDQVREVYRELSPIPCTNCGYCIPCPGGVEIPRIFDIYNEAMVYDNLRMGQLRYNGRRGLKEEQRADQCNECAECEEACPQKIPIRDWLKKTHTSLKMDP